MTFVYGTDTFPAQYAYDGTYNLNLTSGSYVTLTPEVGVYFVAPTSGRVAITVGGGARDNTNDNRVFTSVEVYRDDSSGSSVLAANVATGGYGTPGTNSDAMYGSRTFMLDGLTRGFDYYARLVTSVETTGGTTADVASRDILVEPLP